MKLGVAICAYYGHIPHLKTLLNSIQRQTRLPDHVVVHCSSSKPEDIPYDVAEYSFPLTIQTDPEKRNASQNRNLAARLLQTDLISFFDADDIMHPQRLEFVEKGFESDVQIVLHNYASHMVGLHEAPEWHRNVLTRCRWGSTIFTRHIPGAAVHNSQPTVRRAIWEQIPFREEDMYRAKEDTVFCTDVIMAYPSQTLYCHNVLSQYTPSRTMEAFYINEIYKNDI